LIGDGGRSSVADETTKGVPEQEHAALAAELADLIDGDGQVVGDVVVDVPRPRPAEVATAAMPP
jgi:hypothetical protein